MEPLGDHIPTIIQNWDPIDNLGLNPECDQSVYISQFMNRAISLRNEDYEVGCCLGDKFDTIPLNGFIGRNFVKVLPKFYQSCKMEPHDAIVWQGKSYRPISWIRVNKKWVPIEFMDMKRSMGQDLSEGFLVGCKTFVDNLGNLLDEFKFSPHVVLRHRPTGLVTY
ncbi:hypothetical protein ACO1O0_009230 [Amphichorda felina]